MGASQLSTDSLFTVASYFVLTINFRFTIVANPLLMQLKRLWLLLLSVEGVISLCMVPLVAVCSLIYPVSSRLVKRLPEVKRDTSALLLKNNARLRNVDICEREYTFQFNRNITFELAITIWILMINKQLWQN